MTTQKRGFAALSPERRREIASKGGKAAWESGNGHRFEPGSELASEAGRKGGSARRRKAESKPTSLGLGDGEP